MAPIDVLSNLREELTAEVVFRKNLTYALTFIFVPPGISTIWLMDMLAVPDCDLPTPLIE